MSSRPTPKRENLLFNLLFNIAVPTLILMKFSSDKWLGPLWGLIVALAFPVGYGLWDFLERRQANFVSMIGFVSVLLSGGLGLLKADGFWFAVKDAAMPSVIALGILATLRSSRPLVKSIIYNDQILDLPKIDAALTARNNHQAFEKLLVRASYGLAAAFFLSAGLNFAVARYILRSPPGTEAFNAELGKMHTWGAVIMVVPATAMLMFVLMKLISGIEALTGLSQDDIMRGGTAQKKPEATTTPANPKDAQ